MTTEDLPGKSDRRREAAEIMKRDVDPLVHYSLQLDDLSFDPMEFYIDECYSGGDYSEGSLNNLRRVIRQWQAFMESEGRNPLCPSEHHVRSFVIQCIESRGNCRSTVEEKLNALARIFRFFQADPAFPHDTDFDPFELEKLRLKEKQSNPLPPPPLELEDIRGVISAITHIRDRLVVIAQFKLGLRSTELCNVRLPDVNLRGEEISRNFDELGTHPRVRNRPNSIYIPHDREGNKSEQPRILPIDDELTELLREYLFTRPDNDKPWLILSKRTGRKMQYGNINGSIWKPYFRPQYGPTEQHRGVSPHFGRHFFTTWWRVTKEIGRPLVQYMRGDTISDPAESPGKESIDHYVHAYYQDIDRLYRSKIFKFGLC